MDEFFKPTLDFLKALTGYDRGERFLRDKIDGWERDGYTPRVGWYPSSGIDYRWMFYTSETFSQVCPSVDDVAPPDVMIMTDCGLGNLYVGDLQYYSQFDSSCTYKDGRTRVCLNEETQLPSLHTKFDSAAYHFPKSPLHNTVIGAYAAGSSDIVGSISIPVIQTVVQNESFVEDVLMRYRPKISHIVKVRDGGNFGGSAYGAGWIFSLMHLFGTEMVYSDTMSAEGWVPKQFEKDYPQIWSNSRKGVLVKPIRSLPSEWWSGVEVTWYRVGKTGPELDVDTCHKAYELWRSSQERAYRRDGREESEYRNMLQYMHMTRG